MFRPLSLLVVAIAVACIALYMLLPMSKIARNVNAEIEATPVTATPVTTATEIIQAPATSAVPQSKTIDDDDSTGQAPPAESTVAIQGHIGNATGDALSGFEIEVESHGFDGEEIVSNRVKSDLRGEFTVDLVPQRQYKLSVKPAADYAGFNLDAFTAEAADSLRNIILEQVKLVDIDGMIVDTNHAPLADFELNVRHLSVVFPDAIIRSDSSGYFALRNFPAGELRIATNTPDYFRIKGLQLRPDEYRNLTLIIDRGNYHLSGWVSDANGTPLAGGAQVTLKSAFATAEYHSYSLRATITDANGAFAFAELSGHRATLGVYASGLKTHIQQHEFESFSDSIEIKLQQ